MGKRFFKGLGVLGWSRATAGMFLALALVASIASAQSGTGVIEGAITDESRAALPGVTVTVKSPALQGGERVAVSDPSGLYRFPTLPPGVYEMTFDLPGFQTVQHQDVRLNIGFVARINAEMKIGTLEETITITGQSPVVDVRTTSGQTNFTQEMLETAPVSRTMWQVFAMTPGVRVTSSPDVGGNTVGNQQGYAAYGVSGQNTPMVEGINTREGSDSAGFFYDYASFEEVQIKALGNSAEVATPGTNFVGIVKSGGDTFHGRYYAAGSNTAMEGANLDDDLRANGVTQGDGLNYFYDVSGDLGGHHPQQALVLRQSGPPAARNDEDWIQSCAGRRQHLRHARRRAGRQQDDRHQSVREVVVQPHTNWRLIGTFSATSRTNPSVMAREPGRSRTPTSTLSLRSSGRARSRAPLRTSCCSMSSQETSGIGRIARLNRA